MDGFLYDWDLRHEKVKQVLFFCIMLALHI